MITNYVQQVEKLLGSMTFDNYKKPTAEQMQQIVSSGRSRILRASESDELCDLSLEFFPFCWSVVGRFGASSYNAVEIASLTRIQPIFIACAIHEYGVDWAHRLFTLKRLVGVDRGLNTIMLGTNWHWSLAELHRRAQNMVVGRSRRQSVLLKTITRGDIKEVTKAVAENGNLVISIVNPNRRDVFIDPRKKTQAVAKRGNAMTIVTPKTERQRLHELAVHPYPLDPASPSTGKVRKIRGNGPMFVLPN